MHRGAGWRRGRTLPHDSACSGLIMRVCISCSAYGRTSTTRFGLRKSTAPKSWLKLDCAMLAVRQGTGAAHAQRARVCCRAASGSHQDNDVQREAHAGLLHIHGLAADGPQGLHKVLRLAPHELKLLPGLPPTRPLSSTASAAGGRRAARARTALPAS